ncbi:hypothetical protein [Nonomuraea sp. NPDC003754]
MPRRLIVLLWTCAVLSAAIACAVQLLAVPDSFAWGGFTYGVCTGSELSGTIISYTYPVSWVPLYWYGLLPCVAVGLAVWAACVRWRRERLGRWAVRVLSWSALLLVAALEPLLFAMDMLLEPGCLDRWGGWRIVWWTVGQRALQIPAPVLMLLAVRPRAPRLPRPVIVASLALAVALAPVADAAAPSRVTVPDEEACGRTAPPGSSAQDWSFLCEARHPDLGFGLDGTRMPDAKLMAYGRHLCAVARRHGGDGAATEVQDEVVGEDGQVVLFAARRICPEMVRAADERAARQRRELEAYEARRTAECAALPRHRPTTRPVRQATMPMSAEWMLEAIEEETEGLAGERLGADDVMVATPGSLAISTLTELGNLCVTVEAYRVRPPVETEGWQAVAEIGYRSTTGVLEIYDGTRTSPDLAVGGAGDYRVRVHQRELPVDYDELDEGEDPPPSEEWLIMVFPGGSGKPATYVRHR